MEEEKKEKAFVVKDRRLFDESGRPRAGAEGEAAPAAEKAAREEPRPASPRPATTAEEPSRPEEEGEAPEVNFYNFILSLSSTAMYHFGDFADPASRASQRNLGAAKQTIDLLTMLQEKTEGNLTDEEKTLLDGLLYELRLRYVKETTGG